MWVEAYRHFSSGPKEKMLSSPFVKRSDSEVERCSVVMWSANVETPEMSESQKGHLELSSARIFRNMVSDLDP